MGRSTASCFKIIACGSDSIDHGDLQAPESKVSSTRNGWSFRKRSARHRVLINTIISEAPSITDKESPESTAANLQMQPHFTVPEKASLFQLMDEKDKISAHVDSNLSRIIVAKEDECSTDSSLEESSAILIQAAIRGYLARWMLLKHKNVIKMQAAVRGHLVRRHAVGTIRLLLAIVKLQSLVRARHFRDFEKQKKNSAVDGLDPTVVKSKRKVEATGTYTYIYTYTYISIEKLLSNKFARQLMESTPRRKPINLKCDPEKSGPAWKWLERWTSVSSVSSGEREISGSAIQQREKESLGYSDGKGNTLDPSGFQSESIGLKSKKDENLFTEEAGNLDICASSDPTIKSPPKLQNFVESNLRYDMAESGAGEIRESDLIQKMDETGNHQVIHASEKFSSEQPETERKMFSRKGSDPSFNDSHLKFKEPLKSGEIGLSDASISNTVAVQDASSECGTELSITSTLDSPDMSDEGVYDLELTPKLLDGANPSRSREKLGHEAFENSSILGTELSYANIDHLERNETVQSSAGDNSVIDSDSLPHEMKLESDQSKDKSLPQVSPRSQLTLPELQTTPSSQSPNSKKSNVRKIHSNDKKRLSGDKSLVSTPNRDSATESSFRSLDETNAGKRRKSFGLSKPDHTDQEPREVSSRNSLPSYMQPTESARAKALSTGSPRSSSDLQEKDISIKSRPYHPGRNEREGSPRVQQSPSQAQQTAKGNGTFSPQDRKWLR